ncbi:hypothetical protein [cyanobacterium endosymbiont of Rhopalodia gibberula]
MTVLFTVTISLSIEINHFYPDLVFSTLEKTKLNTKTL